MWYLKLAVRIMRKSNWQKMLKQSEKKVVQIGCKEKAHTLELSEWKKRVPISSKHSVFEGKNLSQLIGRKLGQVRFVMMSSGSSTKFSMGVFTRKEMKQAAVNTDLFMGLFFDARKKQTLIINASSMGVRVFSNFVVCDTGPRTDIVIGLMKTVAIHYSKIFIIGDPVFIKLMVEEAISEGIDWSTYVVFFISGGEWLAQSLRNYVHKLTGKSANCPNEGCWVGTYGITEVGYPLFFENPELAAYRSNIQRKMEGENIPRIAVPFYFFFRANAFYLENVISSDGLPRMLFTPLSKQRLIPVLRYDTGDLGEIIYHNIGLSHQPMPVVKFWGRDGNYIELNSTKVFVLDLKEIFFSIHNIQPSVTGFFTLERIELKIEMTIQCKKYVDAKSLNPYELQQLLDEVYPNLLHASFCSYYDVKQQMELDFERKFQHLK